MENCELKRWILNRTTSGDEREVDGRNSNQVNKDIRNNEDIIK